MTKEPCVLIQSVVMIGLWIEGSKKSREAATDLHRSLSTAIRTQMVRAYKNPGNLPLLTTFFFSFPSILG